MSGSWRRRLGRGLAKGSARALAIGLVLALGLGLTLAALGSVACGGGGGGGPTQPPGPPPPPPPPPPPETGVFFEPDGAPADATIYLAAEDVTPLAGPFLLRVEVEEIEDLYGLSFDLRFPSDLVRWEEGGTVEGDFLSESGDVETSLLVDRDTAGNLIVGLTRLGDVGGASGSGTLVTLEFAVRNVEDRGRFRFRAEDAYNPDGSKKPETAWLEAAIEIRR